eukprot:CAMPEP_0183745666 /NCGR_PEP_ID=MMETSP0737-20130205/66362_1 /TAXON_ID=385413 /ORGANISM="Thalassiosira miniscula, Strain CCMP1093" /LENGTH=484 /DNA_ID=CAMNT_0025981345 /DNA_START=104 /DNA_END=1558 /DNA_ORIENTATION=+
MSIDPNKELFDTTSAPPPASAPPPTPSGVVSESDPDYDEEARERKIEGGEATTLHLSVTDPQQIGEGRNAHTYYRIDVRQGQYSDPLASVRRRYSDFQWLFQRLHAEKPGAIVPIIPHTQAIQTAKRLSEELIEERRNHLEGFLRRVQVHPELEGAPSLAAFFSPDAEVFEAAKKANPGNGADDISLEDTSAIKEKAKHFFVKVGIKAKVARGVSGLEETPDGARMEEVEHYLSTLENHVKTLSKATLYLVNVSQETSTSMHELGQSLFGLHQTYDPESSTNNEEEETTSKTSNLPSIKAISNVFASLSAINKVKYDENHSKVSAPIHDLEWSIKAARLAVKRRKNCQLTYTTYLQQIKNREAAVDKLTNVADRNETKISDAQTLLEASKQSSSKALSELEAVTQRVFREMDRFKRNVDEDLRKIYLSHAKVQVDYSHQMDTEWGKLVQKSSNGSAAVGSGTRGSVGSGSATSGGSKEAEMLMI